MAADYYRVQGWVRNTLGQAIGGASVYILSQPANYIPPPPPKPPATPTTFTPSPQIQLYSDAGMTPITQPLTTDGFGYYYAYAPAGLYTIAIYNAVPGTRGKLSAAYLDQSVGNIGSTGSAQVVLETNSVANGSQSLLNLVAGANITVVEDGLGDVTITGTVSPTTPLVLENNGTNNGSQTLLNLISGSNITIVDNGVGGLVITSTASGGSGVTSWFTSTDFLPAFPSSTDSTSWSPGLGGSYSVQFVPLRLLSAATVHEISINVTTLNAGNYILMAIYSADGTVKVLDAGTNAFSTASTGIVKVTLGSPITLPSGEYLLGFGNVTSSQTPRTAGLDSVSQASDYISLLNANATRYGLAGNNISAGAMPATLGTLNVPSGAFNIPGFFFE